MQFPGAVLLSLSRSRMFRCPATGWMPNELLNGGAESSESRAISRAILKSCRMVEIPPYSRQEMETCLSHYSDRQWISTGM